MSKNQKGDGTSSVSHGRRMRCRRRLWLALSILPALAVLCIGIVFGWWLLRPNTARINPHLNIEHWAIVSDGMHNSNTDMLYWRGHYYLVHASSPWHFGSTKCQLLLWRSRDARSWELVRSFNIPGSDIRDPKFAVIHDRLFLYVLENNGLMATPIGTRASYCAAMTCMCPTTPDRKSGV